MLTTERLVLEPPEPRDVDAITEYCQDPAFERYLTIPWPYHRVDAEFFIDDVVAPGWAQETEFTWALRTFSGGPLLGVIGWRAFRGDLGFWLGAPHRGHGYMTEATNAVTRWVFDTLPVDEVLWECFLGNAESASVARKAGFIFTGEREADVPARDGGHRPAWHGVLRREDDCLPKTGWPA